MNLADLKIRLEIPAEDTSRDTYLKALLDDAIDYVHAATNNDFKDASGNVVYPGPVKQAIKLLVQAADSNEAIQADSVGGGMSKTLVTGGYEEKARRKLRNYKKMSVIDMRQAAAPPGGVVIGRDGQVYE